MRDLLARELTGLARALVAKERPSDLFGGSFFDFREKLKKLKRDEAERIRAKLEAKINADLTQKGARPVEGVAVKLGSYRGSAFITSAKMKVKVQGENAARELLAYLQRAYSPKYKLKGVTEDGIASYNIR